ncbi:MAG: hypothetical protein CL832_10920 [Crocinitomicaceae bacterium]|nr:hypothetical protein [Crocinitomicaceae bacterium]
MSNARKLADNLPTEGSLSGRNLIINGDMSLSQRIGTTATAITDGNYGLDRWHAYYSGNSFTTQQVTDAPSGFYNSMKLLVTGTTTPNYSFFSQKLEGNNVNHIGLGTANCQSFTVSFYVKSSVAGIYSISMTNGAGDLAYPVQYTINSANTWERKTITVPPITSGTWTKDNTTGLAIRVNLGSPSSRTDTSGAWSSGNFDGADGSTGAVTWATTSGATFYMTGCQLEVGPQSTPFEHEPVGVTLSKAQRYYYSWVSSGLSDNIYIRSPYSTGTPPNSSASASYTFPVTMRANPTMTTTYNYSRFTASIHNAVAQIGTTSANNAYASTEWQADAEL